MSSGLTVRCYRNDRPPDAWCSAYVTRLVSMAIRLYTPGRVSGRRPHAGHHAWTCGVLEQPPRTWQLVQCSRTRVRDECYRRLRSPK